MSKEFTSNICNLFVFHMILYCIIVIYWIYFSKFHIINTHAVIC